MSLVVAGESIWMETSTLDAHASLDGDARHVVDVCIVGSGITGLLCAWELLQSNATVAIVDGEEVAAHRDENGELHRVSAVCTHLHGIILWDQDERDWVRPCHGSRFTPRGEVTHGPARDPLPQR